MHLHKKFLDQMGRTKDIAESLNVSAVHISKWKKTGVPTKYAVRVINLAKSKGMVLDLADFFDV